MRETIKANVIGAIIATVVIGIGAFAIQKISGGGLVSVLGGVTTQDLRGLRVVDWSRTEKFGLYQNGEQDVPRSFVNNPVSVAMVGVDEGVCFLTDIRGNFNGPGERVYIEQMNDHWHLRAYSEQTGMRVFATCWHFFSTGN